MRVFEIFVILGFSAISNATFHQIFRNSKSDINNEPPSYPDVPQLPVQAKIPDFAKRFFDIYYLSSPGLFIEVPQPQPQPNFLEVIEPRRPLQSHVLLTSPEDNPVQNYDHGVRTGIKGVQLLVRGSPVVVNKFASSTLDNSQVELLQDDSVDLPESLIYGLPKRRNGNFHRVSEVSQTHSDQFGSISVQLPEPKENQINSFRQFDKIENQHTGSVQTAHVSQHSYTHDDGSKVSEETKLVSTAGGLDNVLVKSGQYEYFGENGTSTKVKWVADQNGFRIIS